MPPATQDHERVIFSDVNFRAWRGHNAIIGSDCQSVQRLCPAIAYHWTMASGVVTSNARTVNDLRVSARIGAVSYLNTVPLVAGLEKLVDIELTLVPPSRLSEMLGAGDIDVALAPVIESQRLSMDVALAPVGMIGSPAETLTVRLYSQVPADDVTVVHADSESRTSVALAKVILTRRLGRTPDFVEFDARERVARTGDGAEMVEWPETMLLIGDKVVRDSPPAVRYPHQIDLGAEWREMTGLPFTYATWMCAADRAEDPAVRLALAMLDRQRRHNATRLDWLVTTHAPRHAWPTDLARTYLGTRLRYDVTDEHRLAVELFFDEAHHVGALAERRPTIWVEA
jgi:chorismate dehydratase